MSKYELLSNFDIDVLCDMYDIKLNGCVARDQLQLNPIRDGGYVVNLDDSMGQGTHWVALHVRGKECVYFDPFGVVPPKEVIAFCKGKNFVYNQDRIQAMNQNCCGYYCIAFLHFMTHHTGRAKMLLYLFCKPYDLEHLNKNDNILQLYLKNIM